MQTSTEYRRPYRPLPVSIFNAAGRAARRLGFGGPLNVDRMVAAARLTPLGARIQQARIVSALSTRLRVERLLRAKPEILDIELGKIILIAGLQRTATTLLHRLIAAGPGIRSLSCEGYAGPRGSILRRRQRPRRPRGSPWPARVFGDPLRFRRRHD